MYRSLLFWCLCLSHFCLKGQIVITQYYEGNSSDKFLEITNMGDSPYDLAFEGIYAYLFANAKADDPANNTASVGQALSGVIEPLESFLLKNGLASSPAYAVSAGTGANFCTFNGDDLVILSTAADGLSNPGNAWAQRIDVVGNGSNWGMDVSYYREPSITTPGTSFDLAEWISVSITVVGEAASAETAYLGTHLSVLPVQLLHFEGSYVNGRVALEFATAQEYNNDYFQLERSNDNGLSFEKVGSLPGQSQSNEKYSYYMIDENPPSGWNYYRLRQVDVDGSTQLFGPIGVWVEPLAPVYQVGPVPTNDRVSVRCSSSLSPHRFTLLDAQAQPLREFQLAPGQLELEIDLSLYPAGSYALCWLSANGEQQCQQLLKQ